MSGAETDIEMDDGRIHIKPGETGGLSDIWIAGQPVGNLIQSLNKRVDRLEREAEEERQQREELEAELGEYKKMVAQLHGQSDGSEYGSKKELAMHIAHDEAVRVSTKGISGGAIEYGTVRDIADRQYDRTLHSGTIYNAFDDLEKEHAYLAVVNGEKGPNTKNKKLVCEREDVPKPVIDGVKQQR